MSSSGGGAAKVFETNEEFVKVFKEQFINTLQSLTQSVTGVTQPHADIFQISVRNPQNPFQGEIYSVFRDANTKEANWVKGEITKSQGKNIN